MAVVRREARRRDGLACLLVALAAGTDGAGAATLDFASDDLASWSFGPDATAFTFDATIARGGAGSLRADVDGDSVRFSRRLARAELTGDRLRIAAHVRTDADAAPGLWVRITAPSGLVYVDRVTAERPPGVTWTEIALEAPLASRAERVEFGGSVSGHGTAWFDGFSLEAHAAADLPAPAPAATRYVDAALAIISSHSVRRREIDWAELTARVRVQTRGARDAEDAYLAVRYTLGELDDGHSYFMTPAQMRRIEQTPVSNARTGRPSVAPRGSFIAPGIGYLLVPGFAGGDHGAQAAFATELQDIVARLDGADTCGFVVDLRDNRGGNLWPMLVGLGPLLGEGEVGAAIYPDSNRRVFWYRDGKAGLDDFVQLRVPSPYTLGRAATRVAVLTGRATASAAEVLAAAFRAAPQSRSFGAATRGVHSSTRVFPLADGAAVVLAVAATSNRRDEIFTGPIEPDEPVSVPRGGDRSTLERDPVVAAAVDWLAGADGCARPRPTPAAAGAAVP